MRFARLLAAIVCGLLAACGKTHQPPPATRSAPVAVWAQLDLAPLDLSPDGELRLLVRLRYRDAGGARVHIPPGGHVDVSASRGSVQWQPRIRYGDPAAIVRLRDAGPLAVHVASDLPRVPRRMDAHTDTRAWRLPPVTARALGPHVVVIGWFPRLSSGSVRIARSIAGGRLQAIAQVAAPATSYRDTAVTPGVHYTYIIERPSADPIDVAVDMPPELPASDRAALCGKAIWLAFDDIALARWNIDAMLAQARSAGIRAIELRLTYGEDAQITPARRAVIDRLIDGAAKSGIAIVGWTVPRAVNYEDLATNVAVAGYRTARGHGITGLAVDLERGADFLGDSRDGTALAAYIRRLREAVGPRVLLVATVEDPYLERLTEHAVPYAAIAAAADVMQPMTYWRMRGAGASLAGMRAELTGSYRLLRRRAGRDVPIDIGGQTANLGNRYGAPPPAEVGASFAVARSLGALGETLFDWDATTPAQWRAIRAAAAPMTAGAACRSTPNRGIR